MLGQAKIIVNRLPVPAMLSRRSDLKTGALVWNFQATSNDALEHGLPNHCQLPGQRRGRRKVSWILAWRPY